MKGRLRPAPPWEGSIGLGERKLNLLMHGIFQRSLQAVIWKRAEAEGAWMV